jgi:hypothetical protein
MPTPKRPRGRPPGSGKNDDAYLARVADMIAANARTKPTTAIKRVIYQRADASELDDTLVRRLQGKWKIGHEAFLEAARARLAQAQAKVMHHDDMRAWRTPGSRLNVPAEQIGALLDAMKPLHEKLRSPEVLEKMVETSNRYRSIVDQMLNSPAVKALADYANSPAAKAIENYMNSPAAKRLAEYVASPQAQNLIKNIERMEKQSYYLAPPPRR